MKRIVIIVFCLFSSTAVFAVDITFSGWTNPRSYLSEFPLNQITQQDLLNQLGVPLRTISFGGAEYWSYPLVPVPDSTRTFTFEIRDGKVTDVQYHNKFVADQHDGLAAKAMQKKD